MKTATVRETGEYAVRGGIIDLFPPGMPLPVRLDFFGDTLDLCTLRVHSKPTVGGFVPYPAEHRGVVELELDPV